MMKNLTIGTRLALGFFMVLALLAAMTAIGIWRMQAAGAMTEELVQEKVKNERLVDEWNKVIEVNAARTTTAFYAADPAHQSEVEALMKASSARATEIQNLLGKILVHPQAKAALAKVMDTRADYTSARAKVFKHKAAGELDAATATYTGDMVGKRERYLAALSELAATQRRLLDEAASEIAEQYLNARNMLLILGVLAVLIGMVSAWVITRSITAPLNKAVRIAEQVSTGDLSANIEVDSTDETGKLIRALKTMNDSLVGIVDQVRSGTDSITTASREIASGNLDLSARTEQQASALQETASSMEELTSTVKINADNARQANDLAIVASQVATRGGQAVAEVVQTMGSINESSRKIVDIISVIDGIAFQTNILALNAAVEAARAGEQGRGFAVVASEVRNLAQRSAAAAKEIKGLIGDSVEKVDAGSRLVDQAGKTMDEVVASISRVTGIMNEINAASVEQSEGIEQINLAIASMDSVTQQNAALVEQAAAAASSMQDEAARLSDAVGVFKLADAAPKMATARIMRSAPRVAPKKPAPALTHGADSWEEL